jgi:hypothetical protein
VQKDNSRIEGENCRAEAGFRDRRNPVSLFAAGFHRLFDGAEDGVSGAIIHFNANRVAGG